MPISPIVMSPPHEKLISVWAPLRPIRIARAQTEQVFRATVAKGALDMSKYGTHDLFKRTASEDRMLKRQFLSVLGMLSIAAFPAVASAQSFPSRPITMVVPYAAGGGLDATARLFAVPFGKALGQTVVVENRPGANGQVGVAAVGGAQADGYTLLFVNGSPMTITPNLAKVTYDVMKDFAPISTIITNDLMIAVTAKFPAKDFQEFVKIVKENPGKYAYSSAGLGGESHLAMELFSQSSGLKMKHVPFAGDGAAIPSVLNGDVPIMITAYNSILPYVKSGQIRPIVTMGQKPLAQLDKVPTLVEVGYPQLVIGAWFGLYAPDGTPADVVGKLNAATAAALKDPAVSQRISELGMSLAPSTPTELTEKLRDENARWQKVIKDADIKLN